MPTRLISLALLSLHLVPTRAFWRLPCQGSPLVVERADPLTHPGAVSQHVHAIHGGSNFNLDMSSDDAMRSECTSCNVKQDLSNYWTPQLYFAWKNGSFTSVGGGNLLVYYMQHSHATDRDPVEAFPKGFRMLVGNPYTRSYDDSSPMARGIGWNCLGGEGLKTGGTKTPAFPSVNCKDSLRAEIMFPSCWDGKNVDSSDHLSHMAFPEEGELGPCPDSHPKRLITIFYEVWWSTASFKDVWKDAMNSSQPFVLSTGDPLGYGLHGDFLNGWDFDVLQEATKDCTSSTGVIEECAVFEFNDRDQSDPNGCVQSSAVREQSLGTIDALPGCNPVDYGPGDVTVCNEDDRPGIEDEITVSGYLVRGETTKLKVKKKKGTPEGDARVSQKSVQVDDGARDGADSPNSTGSTRAAGPTDLDPAPTRSPVADSSMPTTLATLTDARSETTTTERNKALFLSLYFLVPTVVFVAIVLCCNFTCGRRGKKTMKRERDEDAQLTREGEPISFLHGHSGKLTLVPRDFQSKR
ncbi:hypothetical protein JCM11491_005934 [Sporobolomyces phaffii]